MGSTWRHQPSSMVGHESKDLAREMEIPGRDSMPVSDLLKALKDIEPALLENRVSKRFV